MPSATPTTTMLPSVWIATSLASSKKLASRPVVTTTFVAEGRVEVTVGLVAGEHVVAGDTMFLSGCIATARRRARRVT